jgi:catechol 2,3-dioxygenase
MGKYQIPVEMIDRHGVTRVKTVYYFDPSGNRNEIFCDGYTYYPDSPVLTWTVDNLGLAAFSQSLFVPESFLTVHT